MFFLLAFLFLVLPIVELYVLIQVAQGIGTLQAIAVMIIISVVGAWLVKAEGFAIMNRVRAQLGQMKMPAKEVVDGALILFAGALLLTPGFVTDGFGLLCLFPPSRAVIRTALMRRYKDRVTVTTAGGSTDGPANRGPSGYWGPSDSGGPATDDVIDVSGIDITEPERPQDTIDE